MNHTKAKMPGPGSVVYFKRFKTSSRKKAKEYQVAGSAFGIMLGHVPLNAMDPNRQVVMMQMGQIGLLSFDDVMEFLGKELGEKCVEMFQEKYYPKLIVPPVGPHPSPKLVLPPERKVGMHPALEAGFGEGDK